MSIARGSREAQHTFKYERIESKVKETTDKSHQVIKQLLKLLDRKEGIHDVIIVEGQKPEIKINGKMREEPSLSDWNRGPIFELLKVSGDIKSNYHYVREEAKGKRGNTVVDEKVIMVFNKEIKGDEKGRGVRTEEVYRHYDIWEEVLGETRSHDFTTEFKDKVLRCHISCVHPDNLSLTIRVAPKEVPSYDKLNLPQGLDNVVKRHRRGLILISGVVSSGKTTTANSIIDVLNKNRAGKERKLIITAEDPVEYVHKDINAKIIQRRVGKDTPSFAQAARDALRESANVVYLGEVRTWEDMSNALQLSETGHLVITTIHSNSVLDTVERFVMSAPPNVQENVRSRFNENLLGVAYQELIPVEDKRYPLITQFFIDDENGRKAFRDVKNRKDLEKLFNEGGDTLKYKQNRVEAAEQIRNITGVVSSVALDSIV